MSVPTWESIAPLVKPARPTVDEAIDCLERHRRWIAAVVRRALGPDVPPQDFGDALHDVILAVARRAERKGGLDARREGSAAAFLRRELTFRVLDWLRRGRGLERPDAGAAEGAVRAAAPPSRPPAPTPEEWWDALPPQVQGRIEAFARRRAANVPEPARLAWLSTHAPHLVERRHVDAAARYESGVGSRWGPQGLLRGAAETWEMLRDWRGRHADCPWSAPARAELAFVLRCDRDGTADDWRREDPEGFARARRTLDKWLQRARKAWDLPPGPRRTGGRRR